MKDAHVWGLIIGAGAVTLATLLLWPKTDAWRERRP